MPPHRRHKSCHRSRLRPALPAANRSATPQYVRGKPISAVFLPDAAGSARANDSRASPESGTKLKATNRLHATRHPDGYRSHDGHDQTDADSNRAVANPHSLPHAAPTSQSGRYRVLHRPTVSTPLLLLPASIAGSSVRHPQQSASGRCATAPPASLSSQSPAKSHLKMLYPHPQLIRPSTPVIRHLAYLCVRGGFRSS